MLLSDIQNQLKDVLLNADSSTDKGANNEQALNAIFETGRIPLNERLGVYRGNVMNSLINVITTNFPITENLVGEEFMGAMAKAFIKHRPPEGGCLNQYGANFPAFITTFEPAASLPYLADVARFEWARHKAYYAQDDLALTAKDLGAIPPEDLGELILRLRDSVNLIASPHPISAIRAFCENENRGEDETLDLDQGGAYLMISRPKLKVNIEELDEASFTLLQELAQEIPLGSAAEKVINEFEDFNFQAFLQTHLHLQTFLPLPSNHKT